MTESTRPIPVILLVAAPDSRDALAEEFGSRYARDYDVRAPAGPRGARELAESLVGEGRQSAVIGLDFALEGDPLDLMDELLGISPSSKRVVLIPFGHVRDAVETLRPELGAGRDTG